MTVEIAPSALPFREIYKLMTASILPRPIAWVSTIRPDGGYNLAPFSFFNAVCPNPPTIVFCPNIRVTDGGQKDTYENIRVNGEFVVNFVTEELAEKMNITSAELPPDSSEFERAGLTPEPSIVVSAPCVKESPIHFECRLREIITISNEPGGGHLIIGTIVHLRFAETVYREGNYLSLEDYHPIGRLMGSEYCAVRNRFAIRRPQSEIPV